MPTWGAPDERFPVVVALHGRGEAVKSPAEGALGWPRDYALVRAIDRLRAPPLREADYEGLAEPAPLAEVNASLATRPFGGLVVVCPWLPDVRPAATADVTAFARFLLDVLLPRVRRETPALATPEATGIDGVSLGGVVALRIGLAHPEAFGAVGGIQPAFSEGRAPSGRRSPRRPRAPPGPQAAPAHQPRRLLPRRRRGRVPCMGGGGDRARLRRRRRAARLRVQPGPRAPSSSCSGTTAPGCVMSPAIPARIRQYYHVALMASAQ